VEAGIRVKPGELELLAALLAGPSLLVSVAVLFFGWRILRSTRRSEQAGNERLEILREQQERLKLMYRERSMLQEELERLHSEMDEEERLLELPAPAKPEQTKSRPWWRRMFGG
jgi:Tfp pilus assembly protein PilO